LEEDEERPLASIRVGHLAGEDRDPLAVGARMVERDRELVLGDDETGRADQEGYLLLVVLDGVGAAGLRVVGIQPELALGPALTQEVPAAIERDADLVESHAVARLELAVALALVELVLLGDQLVDPLENVTVLDLSAPRRVCRARMFYPETAGGASCPT
jgi:hypothetical protein